MVTRRVTLGNSDLVGEAIESTSGDLELTQTAASSLDGDNWRARKRRHGSYPMREPLLIRPLASPKRGRPNAG